MKVLSIILCASALVSGSSTYLLAAPPLQRAEARSGEAQSLYRVHKSTRHERTVSQGTVKQRGSVTLKVKDRPKRTIGYESVQTFQIGPASTVLRVTDDSAKVKATFTLSDDGSTSTFSFDDAPSRTLLVNPDETVTFDGVTYDNPDLLAAAAVAKGCVPPNGLESWAAAIEVANAELGDVNKGKNAKKNLKKALKWLVIIGKAIADNLG